MSSITNFVRQIMYFTNDHAYPAFSRHETPQECNQQRKLTTVWSTETTWHGNNKASAKLTTACGETFTSTSARLRSQSSYSMFDQWVRMKLRDMN